MKNYTVHYAVANFKGNGHYQIKVTLMDENGEVSEFHETTTDMRSIDESTELEGQEQYDLLFNTIESAIDDEINNWLLN